MKLAITVKPEAENTIGKLPAGNGEWIIDEETTDENGNIVVIATSNYYSEMTASLEWHLRANDDIVYYEILGAN